MPKVRRVRQAQGAWKFQKLLKVRRTVNVGKVRGVLMEGQRVLVEAVGARGTRGILEMRGVRGTQVKRVRGIRTVREFRVVWERQGMPRNCGACGRFG